ncbi:HNH endonuclease [Bradyrhizobium sp. 41S5]|uniref:HNH endonuclease n=1 Tax=Bradyrhizobium sp. 41S5 TaxID=1404443 RepID=UPI001E4479AD|nr:HNH endonuclease [Bradyrhizobium sp. 41S5]UFX42103.1 HNH endonuclease [Bradyrhizobium sp. 41S5]
MTRMTRARIPTLGPRVPTLDTRKVKPPPKLADPHYQTAEHKNWAEQVKRRAGWRCEYVEDGVRCERSRELGDQMYADHIEEVRDAPSKALDLSNGHCLCASHHTRKSHQARAARMSR